MTAVAVFYHLTRSGLDDTVRALLTRAVAQGWQIMVRAPDLPVLTQLDDKLWLGPEDGFLPHGMAGGLHDSDQPVLLGSGAIGNAAKGLMLLAGADTSAGEVAMLERVWVLFDGGDATAVQAARGMWSRFVGWGLGAQYWSDDSGSWVKKMEKAADPGPDGHQSGSDGP